MLHREQERKQWGIEQEQLRNQLGEAAYKMGLREIVVRAWYPAEGEPGRSGDPYMTPTESRAFGDVIGAAAPGGGLLYSHARLATTHGRREAPLAASEEPFPVLAFSHGYTSFLAQNTPLMEELASHGYVVFSLAHTWDGSAVFPDGRVTGLGPHVTAWSERSASIRPGRTVSSRPARRSSSRTISSSVSLM